MAKARKGHHNLLPGFLFPENGDGSRPLGKTIAFEKRSDDKNQRGNTEDRNHGKKAEGGQPFEHIGHDQGLPTRMDRIAPGKLPTAIEPPKTAGRGLPGR